MQVKTAISRLLHYSSMQVTDLYFRLCVPVLASTDKILPKCWVTVLPPWTCIFSAARLMLCSVQAGSRQLSESSLSHHCHQGYVPPEAVLTVRTQSIQFVMQWSVYFLGAWGTQCLLQNDSSLLISPFTCALPSLKAVHAIVLEKFVMAELHPVGNAQHYPFGYWLDPSRQREDRAPQHRPCRVALKCHFSSL